MDGHTGLGKYLKEEIFPQISPPPYGKIEMIRLAYQKPVYLFIESARNIMVVGKSYKYGFIPLEEAWLLTENEYLNLKLLRERFDMSNDSYRVIAPLGSNKELSALLVTEKAPGQILDYYIARAIYEHQAKELLDNLSYLARFFVKLHRNSETGRQVSSDLPSWYLGKLLDSLDSLSEEPLSSFKRDAIEKCATDWWQEKDIFTEDTEVIVHGDATPTNFFLYKQQVVAIDLERMKWADRCWDLGFMAAELKHHFMWRMGDSWAAEPFIGHFLWEYVINYGDIKFFHAITRKIPLYMALGLLRIARNYWLDEAYRKKLVEEAKQCLEYGLQSSTVTAH